MGFFIAYLGFKNTGLAAFSDSGLALGDFTQPAVLLALITLAVMGVLTAYKVRGAILIGIIVGTIISIPMGVSTLPTTLVSLPDMSEIGNLVLCYDFKSVLADIPGALVWIFILFTSDFFATFGALIAVGAQTNMLDENGNFPQIEKPFLVDAVGTVVGSASNDCSNLLAEIRAAYLLHRLTYSAKAPTGYDLLKMATMGSARLLGRQDEIGSLEAGKAADLFLLNVDLLELAGAKLDPACMLGTVGYARPAELVMVNGRVVVEHGRVLGMDEEQTRVRAQQLVDGMLQKAE